MLVSVCLPAPLHVSEVSVAKGGQIVLSHIIGQLFLVGNKSVDLWYIPPEYDTCIWLLLSKRKRVIIICLCVWERMSRYQDLIAPFQFPKLETWACWNRLLLPTDPGDITSVKCNIFSNEWYVLWHRRQISCGWNIMEENLFSSPSCLCQSFAQQKNFGATMENDVETASLSLVRSSICWTASYLLVILGRHGKDWKAPEQRYYQK